MWKIKKCRFECLLCDQICYFITYRLHRINKKKKYIGLFFIQKTTNYNNICLKVFRYTNNYIIIFVLTILCWKSLHINFSSKFINLLRLVIRKLLINRWIIPLFSFENLFWGFGYNLSYLILYFCRLLVISCFQWRADIFFNYLGKIKYNESFVYLDNR